MIRVEIWDKTTSLVKWSEVRDDTYPAHAICGCAADFNYPSTPSIVSETGEQAVGECGNVQCVATRVRISEGEPDAKPEDLWAIMEDAAAFDANHSEMDEKSW